MFRNHQNGSFDNFTEEQKKMIEAIESIVINYLFKNCNQDEKFEKKNYEPSFYCFIDEV